MAWLTVANRNIIELTWPDSHLIDDDVLTVFLGAAEEACVAYAPTLAEGEQMPRGWPLAQVLQARNVYNAGAAGPGGQNDGSGYGLSTFPLDWQVKQLLRPETAFGGMF